jgi:predicted ATPase
MKKLKIAVTGGPSGGKTTLIEALQKDMADEVAVVPEAASILYRGHFPRRPSPAGRIHAQRAIYFTQRELEELIAVESKANALVCDRGSLDAIAYWPEHNAEDFFHSLNTSAAQEYSRYDWVIHLDTADSDSFDTSNSVRTESHAEAVVLNTLVKQAWQGHPCRIVIPHEANFLTKIAKAKAVIEKILSGAKFPEVFASV